MLLIGLLFSFSGYQWTSFDVSGFQGMSVKVCRCQWLFLDFNGNQSMSLNISGCQGMSAYVIECHWMTVKFQ